MSKKVVKRIAIGVGLYAAFALALTVFYPDAPTKMNWEDRQSFNKVHIDKLEKGITHKQIIEMLGAPDISEAKMIGEDTLQVMYYRTHHKKPDGITSQDECTPLLFKNEKLVALGEKAEEQFSNDS